MQAILKKLEELKKNAKKLSQEQQAQELLQVIQQQSDPDRAAFARWVYIGSPNDQSHGLFTSLAAINPQLETACATSLTGDDLKDFSARMNEEIRLWVNKEQNRYLKNNTLDKEQHDPAQLPPRSVLLQIRRELDSRDDGDLFYAAQRIFRLLDNSNARLLSKALIAALLKVDPASATEEQRIRKIVTEQARLVQREEITENTATSLQWDITAAKRNAAEAAAERTTPLDVAKKDRIDQVVKAILGENSTLESRSGFTAYLQSQNADRLAITPPQVLWQKYQQAQPEVIYQNALIAKAKQNTDYRFDSQGSLLTSVTLTEADHREILQQIKLALNGQLPPTTEALGGKTPKAQLEALLGGVISSTTLCNIDVKKDPELFARFTTWLNQEPQTAQPIPSNIAQWLDATRQNDRESIAARMKSYDNTHPTLAADFAASLFNNPTALNEIFNQLHRNVETSADPQHVHKRNLRLIAITRASLSQDGATLDPLAPAQTIELIRSITQIALLEKISSPPELAEHEVGHLCNALTNDPALRAITARQQQYVEFQKNRSAAVKHFIENPAVQAESGSIIGLQNEMEMHISLALNVLKKAFVAAAQENKSFSVTPQQWDTVRSAALKDIEEQVRVVYQRLLTRHYTPTGGVNIRDLNRDLDKARKPLADNCYGLLSKHAVAQITDFKDLCQNPAVKRHITKHAFKTTTASGNDYLSTTALGLTGRMQGSENTAHHKAMGLGQQAARLIRYNDGSCVMRLPSIPDPDASFGTWKATHIADTKIKINEVVTMMRQQLGAQYTGPIIFNRETSIPTMKGDSGNSQAWRLEIEIKALHQVNAALKDPKQFVFIQGIPVNQHTQDLGYESSSTLVRETTVMAEMALLANLNAQVKNDSISNTYQKVMEHYQTFLLANKDKPQAQLCKSNEGKLAITALGQLKETLQKNPPSPTDSTDLKVLANQALVQIFAHNLHCENRYGMLIQALSTYAQDATIAGCKSANERFSAVEGRAILLRLLNLEPCELNAARTEMISALKGLIANPADNIQALVTTMNAQNNLYTVQINMAAAASLNDQGAADKLGVFKKSDYGTTFQSTNKAEDRVLDEHGAEINRKFSSEASAMQAHRGNKAKDLLTAIADTPDSERLQDQVRSTSKDSTATADLSDIGGDTDELDRNVDHDDGDIEMRATMYERPDYLENKTFTNSTAKQSNQKQNIDKDNSILARILAIFYPVKPPPVETVTHTSMESVKSELATLAQVNKDARLDSHEKALSDNDSRELRHLDDSEQETERR